MRSAFKILFSVIWFLAFGLLLFTQPARAQSWTQAARSGGSGMDAGTVVKVSQDGSHYVAGFFSATASFQGTTLTSAGSNDIFLARYAVDGQLLWIVQAGGSGEDAPNDLALDDAGNTYVTGWFGFPNSSVFIAKYSAAGNLLWLQKGTASFPSINQGGGVAVNTDANTLYVTGNSQGDTAFSSSDGTTNTVPGVWTWHMFLVKYDLSGNFKWGETNQASPNSIPSSVAVDSENSAYVTGWFEGGATFHSHNGLDQTIYGRSGPVQNGPDYPNDAFIAKYDGNGNLKWVNGIGGYKAVGQSIAASGDGRIAVTGYIGNINGDTVQRETIVTSQPGGSNISLGGGQFTTPYNRDVFIAIYSSAGVLISASRLGSEDQDRGSGIGFDNANNLYVAGVFGSTLQAGNQLLTGTGTTNLFVLKYTAAGVAWGRSADGAGSPYFLNIPALSVTQDDSVWVTGAFSNTATFDGTTLQSAGADDVFVAELKSHSPHCDFNNDGFDDLAIGVPGESINGVASAGAVQVLYGRPGGLSATNNQFWNAASSNVPGNPSNSANFGSALACGDFNGDGVDDLAIGAPNASSGNSGSVTILYGISHWRLGSAKSQLWNQSGLGLPKEGRFGESLAAGDFNGDGYTDVAIGIPEQTVQGAPSAGAVLVLFGSNTGLSSSGKQFLTETSPVTNGWYGYSLVSADFGKNTTSGCYDDLAIGAPGDAAAVGAVHVLYSSQTGFSNAESQTWSAQSLGDYAGHMFGSSLATGNFHASSSNCAGKKISDLAIGAPFTPVGTISQAGAVFVLPADDSGLIANGSQRWTQNSPGIAESAEKGDHFGAALAGGHSSSRDYLAIGVPGESVGLNVNAGAVHVLYVDPASGMLTSNNSKLLTQNTTGIKDSVESGDLFGAALVTGDFNGNGTHDLAIGVPGEDLNGLSDVGALNVLYNAGTSQTQFFHQNGPDMKDVEEALDRFGGSLCQ